MQSTSRRKAPLVQGGAMLSAGRPGPGAYELLVARCLAAVVAGLGALILIGWIADVPILRSWFPGETQAKANAAVCFVLLGTGLLLKASRPSDNPWPVRVATLNAVGAMLIAGLTLAQYAFDRDFGIDQLLFHEPNGNGSTVHPGRMTMPTTLCVLSLGFAILTLRPGQVRGAITWLVLPAMLVSGLAFIGHMYDLPTLTTLGRFSPISAPSGITLLLLGMGIALADGGRMVIHGRRSGRTIGFVFALVLLLFMAGAVWHNTDALIHNNRRVVHTHEVLNRLTALLSAVQDIETAARGYVVANDAEFLRPFGPALEASDRLQDELRDMTADNPLQQSNLSRLAAEIDAKIAHSSRHVELQRIGEAVRARESVANGEGKRRMDSLRQIVMDMRTEEDRLLDERQDQVEDATQRTLLTLGTGLLLSIALLVTIFAQLRREIDLRTSMEAALRRSEESLRVTLHSIGDGVLATDTAGNVTLMNHVAEDLTGWTLPDAQGRPIEEVFRIIHETTRAPAPIPVAAVLATGEIQGLANHTALIARNGTERAIADSAAPIRDAQGRILGVVLVFRDVSAERVAERALRESENRYHSLFESIDQGFCLIELIFDDRGEPEDYRFLEVNPAFERQSGLKNAVGRRMREFAPDLESEWFATMGGVAVTGVPIRLQRRAEALNRTFDVYAFRFGAAENRQVAVLFSDVTERQKAQEELDQFFKLSLDFLCIASADGTFKRASPGITDILGWTPNEFIARPYLTQVHPDDRLATEREVQSQITSGTSTLHFENRYQHKDGSWRTLSWRSVPRGELMYATARDVTESKKKEEQIQRLNAQLQEHAVQLEIANVGLRENRAELQSLFESLPGLYLVLTLDYRITAVSDAYLQATMTERAAILDRDLFEVFPDNPDDPKADGVRNLRASLDRVAAKKVPDTMPIQKYDVRRPDGTFEEKYWSPINSPLLGAGGRLRYIIHRAEDVTDFVKRRESGKVGGEDLKARMEAMEAEIFQSSQKVQAANQQLQAANQELESFSYSVSHDLRAPLRHVQGYVEMLTTEAQAQLSDKARRYLKTIADAAREMGQLIDNLLAFSRMGRTEMREATVNFAALAAETRQSLENTVKGRDIRWQIADLPAVQGDAAMLRQVLVNLMSNAVKYTGQRPVAEIELGTAGTEEGRIIFFIRDNGAGFDMRYADKLFGVFQRLHRNDEFEGTGIGLANVRRIITRHGGRIWAKAAVNEGATFYFTVSPAPGKPAAASLR